MDYKPRFTFTFEEPTRDWLEPEDLRIKINVLEFPYEDVVATFTTEAWMKNREKARLKLLAARKSAAAHA